MHSDSPSSPLAAVPSFLLLPPAGGGWAAGLVPVPAAAFPGVVPPLPDLGRLMPARAAAVLVPEAEAAVLVIVIQDVPSDLSDLRCDLEPSSSIRL